MKVRFKDRERRRVNLKLVGPLSWVRYSESQRSINTYIRLAVTMAELDGIFPKNLPA